MWGPGGCPAIRASTPGFAAFFGLLLALSIILGPGLCLPPRGPPEFPVRFPQAQWSQCHVPVSPVATPPPGIVEFELVCAPSAHPLLAEGEHAVTESLA